MTTPRELAELKYSDAQLSRRADAIEGRDMISADMLRSLLASRQATPDKAAGVSDAMVDECLAAMDAVFSGKYPGRNFDDMDDADKELAKSGVRAALAHFAQSQSAEAVRDGWVMVPLEPTQAMIDKGTDEHQCEQGDPYYSAPQLTDGDAIAIYKAMIDAAIKGQSHD